MAAASIPFVSCVVIAYSAAHSKARYVIQRVMNNTALRRKANFDSHSRIPLSSDLRSAVIIRPVVLVLVSNPSRPPDYNEQDNPHRFQLVQLLVYGFAAIILTSVMAAVIAKVISK